MSEWEVTERIPRNYVDGPRDFEVWMRDGSVRQVQFVGMDSTFLTPGTFAFTDCTHPLQNVICDDDRIVGWRERQRAKPRQC
jgi:hypothetical protein